MSFEEFNKINSNAEEIAHRIFKLTRKEFPSITALIKWFEENFNFKISVVVTTLQSCSGMVLFDPETRGCKIRINKTEPVARQRFTLCHEVAHIIRNWNLIYGFSTHDVYTAKGEERFCERFAAAFLMPAELFVCEWNSLSNDDLLKKARVAKFFGVSVDAVNYRAKELRLIK